MQHRAYTKNRPSKQNDSFLRHWCVYSNLGRDDVCEGVCEVNCMYSCPAFGKKSPLLLLQVARGGGGARSRTFPRLTTDGAQAF